MAALKIATEPVKLYLSKIKEALEAGDATEHTHRPALKDLIEHLGADADITAVNEPKRVSCGAPDYAVKRRNLSIGYIEAKDMGRSLDEAEDSPQLERYKKSLHNLILTDYLEFRWYVDGEPRGTARLARKRKGKLVPDKDGVEKTIDILSEDEAPSEWQKLFGAYRILSEEANAASRVKRDLPIMVVLGNPPYSGHSANSSWEMVGKKKRLNFIGQLLQDYYYVDGKPLGEKNPKWLQDDYVKFIRWGQWRIERTGKGVLALITNHGYLDNPTFRGMRQQLMATFDEIYIVNLHGNTKKKEISPDGSDDENVFDIQQGVAIGIFIKSGNNNNRSSKIYFADLWGTREEKYGILSENTLSTTKWQELEPESPLALFVPQNNSLRSEYESGYKISDAMPVNSIAMNSHRDHFAIGFDASILESRYFDLVSQEDPDEELRSRYNLLDNSDFKLTHARDRLRKIKNSKDIILPCLYRPFDFRFILYDSSILDRPRIELNSHFIGKPNLGLITTRQTREPFSALAANGICGQHKIVAKYDGSSVFPLYAYASEKFGTGEQIKLLDCPSCVKISKGRIPNLNPDFVSAFASRHGLEFVSDGHGDLATTFGPEDIFNYIYAVFHSPTYRQRYAEFLKIDFPRVPMTASKELFRKLCILGEELVALHLLESPYLSQLITRYPVVGDNIVEKGFPKFVSYEEGEPGYVYINKNQYFEGVPKEVWQFHVGGYQVCEKWLKDRRGRQLSFDDLMHYQKVVVALKETIRLMGEIDRAIPGWPIE